MPHSFVDILHQHAAQQPDRIAITLPAIGDTPEINLTLYLDPSLTLKPDRDKEAAAVDRTR